MSGTLYICGTPIGNLEDISLRVIRILKEVDLIAAEDTRHTLKLLNHYDIKAPLTSFHSHNAGAKGRELLDRLKKGGTVALVTDAGMPVISDPGQTLVALCHEHGVTVTAAPGPTAATTALALCGVPSARFIFEGFLPKNQKDRLAILRDLRLQTRAVVFYEAPHHLLSTLMDMRDVFGGRDVILARELTKKFEEIRRFSLPEACEHILANSPKGEYVIVLPGYTEKEAKSERARAFEAMTVSEHLAFYENALGLLPKEAMKAVARDRGVSKSAVYAKMVKEKNGG